MSTLELQYQSPRQGSKPIALGTRLAAAVNVLDFGAVGDGATNDTAAIEAALASVNQTGGTLFFPAGTYLIENTIKLGLDNRIGLAGETGSVIQAVKPDPQGPSWQEMFRFNRAINGITLTNLEFDGNQVVSQVVRISNNDQNTVTGEIQAVGCIFANALQTTDTPYFSSGLYMSGPFASIQIDRCTMRNITSIQPDQDRPQCSGATVAMESGQVAYSKNVVFTDCQFIDIHNATMADSDGIQVLSTQPDGPNASVLVVKGCRFTNCKGRGIKSQVKNCTVVANTFYRDAYNGNQEIDLQFSGGTVSGNLFYCDGYRADNTINATIRPDNFSNFVAADNLFIFINVEGNQVISNTAVNAQNNLRNISIANNMVVGVAAWFAYFYVPQADDNFVSVTGNTITGVTGGFIGTAVYVDGSPTTPPVVLRGAFTQNAVNTPGSVGVALGPGTEIRPDIWAANSQMTAPAAGTTQNITLGKNPQGPGTIETYGYQDEPAIDVSFVNMLSNFGADSQALQFTFLTDGEAIADLGWSSNSTTFAQMFEWADGNPCAEDRRGWTVTLEGDKMRPAQACDEIIGVVAEQAALIGDRAGTEWQGKFLRDALGSYELDERGRRCLNPAYDPNRAYVPRSRRKQWSSVALAGKVRVRVGQPVGPRWLKTREIGDQVEEWLIRS